MPAGSVRSWNQIDVEERHTLDSRFLDELRMWYETPLSSEGIRAYLAYRHQRPDSAITTYEEGQIRSLLHRYADLSVIPDPVRQEDHVDGLEVFGAERLHMTNSKTYVSVMVVLTLIAVVALLVWTMRL